MQRYMLKMSYHGAKFSGSQKMQARLSPHLWTRESVLKDRKTIQGALESLLIRLCPINEPKVYLSSRTDAGVHSTGSTCNVDLQRSAEGKYFFEPIYITTQMNKLLIQADLDIKILRTFAVPGNFDCRNEAVSRTYIYKFFVWNLEKEHMNDYVCGLNLSKSALKRVKKTPGIKIPSRYYLSQLPLADLARTTEVRIPFDIDKAKQAVDLFNGEVNLGSFASKKVWNPCPKRRKDKPSVIFELPHSYFNRNISHISLTEIPPPLPCHFEPIYQCGTFYMFKVSSKSFFRNQIRKMVGIILSVGSGKISLDKVKFMLENPSLENNIDGLMAPPDGLYLTDIDYDKEMRDKMEEAYSKLPVGPAPDPLVITHKAIDWSYKDAIFGATHPSPPRGDETTSQLVSDTEEE